MTLLEKEALVLFKEHTHLQLKAFRKHFCEEQIVGAATEPYELMLLDKALEYHGYYLTIKLTQSPKKAKWVQTKITDEDKNKKD